MWMGDWEMMMGVWEMGIGDWEMWIGKLGLGIAKWGLEKGIGIRKCAPVCVLKFLPAKSAFAFQVFFGCHFDKKQQQKVKK